MVTWYKLPLIIGGALVVTAMGIDAADTLGGSRATLLATVLGTRTETSVCPSDMTPVWFETGFMCVDRFEASVAPTCVHAEPTGVVYTQDNITDVDCVPASVSGVVPWRYVTRTQAEQLCGRAGKQLVTPAVWYQAALGTESSRCNTDSILAVTGAYEGCTSGVGARDVVGNVWEWVAGDVVQGTFAGRVLAPSGYVSQVDAIGIATVSSSTSSVLYGDDYSWSTATGTTAMMRGGFYGGRSDTGLYSTHAGIASDFASAAVGFRCMKAIETI